jgi:hypothetical protein
MRDLSLVVSDITTCVRYIRISVYSKKTLSKDVEVGYVELDLEDLDRRDEWMKLKMTIDTNNPDSVGSSNYEADQTSAIRINVNVINHFTLPNKDYSQGLYEIYSKNIPLMCKQLIQLNNVNRDDLARTTVNYYVGIGRELELLHNLIKLEIFSTEDLNIIFRGNSIATKAIDYYMKIVGMSYLGVTLGDLVKQVYKSKEICEVHFKH